MKKQRSANGLLKLFADDESQGIAAFAAQGGAATLTEGHDEIFSLMQFLPAD